MFGTVFDRLISLFAPKEQRSDKNIRTSGWTEETRYQFHPGDLIAAMRLDSAKYSPHGTISLIELASHTTGKGREYFQSNLTTEGGIRGFNLIILPLLVLIRPYLIESYPEIAKFAESLSKRDLKNRFKSPEETKRFIEEIEEKLGKTISVQPLNIPKKVLDHFVIKLQQRLIFKVSTSPLFGLPEPQEEQQCKL
ncbi:hypothetical protein [Legionella drozanskii]|uniref:Uncharacterized protein n=1 Tax=Legionella drozanskii LLAP-1 TaxID=1212489 RepID=A0A0W0SX28_9GAMM|nr:hypothetical protein [Legionella drozanskii]KTC87860.1 hypothetical protein Ldro_1479 [Legionella drozanskii LLAP-1]